MTDAEDHISVDKLKSLCAKNNQHHHNIPCINLNTQGGYDMNNMKSLITNHKIVPLVQSYPLPFLPCNNIHSKVLNGVSISKNLIQEKHKFSKSPVIRNAQLKYTKRSTLRDKVENLVFTRNPMFVQIPYDLYQLAKFLDADPDPNFNGDENWYYGNGLDHVCIGEVHFILSARGRFNNQLHAIPISYKSKLSFKWKSNYKKRAVCILDNLQPILQVKGNEKGYIVVRKKSKIHICRLELCEDGSPILNQVFYISAGDYPFTCIDIRKKAIVVSNTKRKIVVYSTNSETPNYQISLKTQGTCNLKHNWNSVSFCREDRNRIMFADTCSVALIDTRKDSKENPVHHWCTKTFLETCERVSLLQQSSHDSNYWYIGTTHYILTLDVRQVQNKAFINKIPHFISASPTLCCLSSTADKETVILADQYCNDIRAVTVNWKSGKPHIPATPIYVNTPLDTLHQARINGECLTSSLNYRFDNELVGVVLLNNNDAENDHLHSLFTLRSSGDVFLQNIQFQHKSNIRVENQPEETRNDATIANSVPADQCSNNVEQMANQSLTPTTNTLAGYVHSIQEEVALKKEEPDDENSDCVPLDTNQMDEAPSNYNMNNGLLPVDPMYFDPDFELEEDFELDLDWSADDSDASNVIGNDNNHLDLEYLNKWVTHFKKNNLKQLKTVVGHNVKFPDILGDALIQSETSRSEIETMRSTPGREDNLEQHIEDLKLSEGIDVKVVKCKDTVLDTITIWSDDDTSEDEDVTHTINSQDQQQLNTNEQQPKNNVEVDTLKDIYIVTDEESGSPVLEISTSSSSSDENLENKANRILKLHKSRRTCSQTKAKSNGTKEKQNVPVQKTYFKPIGQNEQSRNSTFLNLRSRSVNTSNQNK